MINKGFLEKQELFIFVSFMKNIVYKIKNAHTKRHEHQPNKEQAKAISF